jgi:nitroimidazol reductase NimA-like FMN-containing flavoprotein (pyridoxamine 5'-phosphate oxidase superfamily)
MRTDQTGVTELSVEECLDLLRRERVGRLAVAIRDHPDVFPINFVIDRGGVVFRTAAGTKLAAAVLGRGVAFEIDGADDETGDVWSVIVKGRAAEIERLHAVIDATQLPLFPWHAGPKDRFVRIEPVAITGRRFRAVDPAVWSDPFRIVP